jgi:hypothetical protein
MKDQDAPASMLTQAPSWHPAALPQPLLEFGAMEPTCA